MKNDKNISSYALIEKSKFDEAMLVEKYPIFIEFEMSDASWVMLEYVDNTDPVGDWILFKGDNANFECQQYINKYTKVDD